MSDERSTLYVRNIDRATRASLREIAAAEERPEAHVVKRLLREAIFRRQLKDNR
jgi:hypothetical protein